MGEEIEDCKMYEFECNRKYYDYEFSKVKESRRIAKGKACVIF